MDYNDVTKRVGTGAAINNEADVQVLVAAGYTHVIDCRGEYDDVVLFTSHPDIHYLYNGTEDDGQPKSTEWFQKGVEFALDGLSRPHYKVYCHCYAGLNRGPSMCYAVLLAQGFDPEVAEDLIRKARPQVGLRYKDDALKAVRELGYQA